MKSSKTINNHYHNHRSTPWRKWWQGLRERAGERERQDREGGEKARDKGDNEWENKIEERENSREKEEEGENIWQ